MTERKEQINLIHLRNINSGYLFCIAKKPNVYSPNISRVKYPYYGEGVKEEMCDKCKPYYDKWLEIK